MQQLIFLFYPVRSVFTCLRLFYLMLVTFRAVEFQAFNFLLGETTSSPSHDGILSRKEREISLLKCFLLKIYIFFANVFRDISTKQQCRVTSSGSRESRIQSLISLTHTGICPARRLSVGIKAASRRWRIPSRTKDEENARNERKDE